MMGQGMMGQGMGMMNPGGLRAMSTNAAAHVQEHVYSAKAQLAPLQLQHGRSQDPLLVSCLLFSAVVVVCSACM
jgi:hypothetical protein